MQQQSITNKINPKPYISVFRVARPSIQDIRQSPMLVKAVIEKDGFLYVISVHEKSYEYAYFLVFKLPLTRRLPAFKKFPQPSVHKLYGMYGPQGSQKLTIEQKVQEFGGTLRKIVYTKSKKKAVHKIDILMNPLKYVSNSGADPKDFKNQNEKFRRKIRGF
jgi:hypothetical protein